MLTWAKITWVCVKLLINYPYSLITIIDRTFHQVSEKKYFKPENPRRPFCFPSFFLSTTHTTKT